MAGFWREHVGKKMERSSEWSKVRNAFVKKYYRCAACGKKKSWKLGLQVHHVVPFSVDPSKELDEDNLITLCADHHMWMGHLGFFQSWNPDVREDCTMMLRKVLNRPTKKKQKAWNKKFWDFFSPKEN
jgi:hypothetical protein